SIGPIIKIKEINNWMKRNREKCIAISPIIGKKAISGPAAQLMKAKGYEVTALGVSEIYKDLISTFIIDHKDSAEIGKITQTTGIETLAENIVFKSEIDATELSKIILKR
ncbi:MAG: 2-phospho-L-lactate transferase, partial [Candidatus Heimdallarchaeota archaeon]|nr:2-phospho-L-lactate transferase [Candidatus Heimdallarchaeota archaeon]